MNGCLRVQALWCYSNPWGCAVGVWPRLCSCGCCNIHVLCVCSFRGYFWGFQRSVPQQVVADLSPFYFTVPVLFVCVWSSRIFPCTIPVWAVAHGRRLHQVQVRTFLMQKGGGSVGLWLADAVGIGGNTWVLKSCGGVIVSSTPVTKRSCACACTVVLQL